MQNPFGISYHYTKQRSEIAYLIMYWTKKTLIRANVISFNNKYYKFIIKRIVKFVQTIILMMYCYLAKQVVVFGHCPLALVHLDQYTRLIV